MLKFIGGLVVVIVIIGAISSMGGSDGDGGSNNTSASQKSNGKKDGGKAVVSTDKKGPLTVGNWEVQGKVVPKDDGLGDFKATFRVKNTSDSDDTPLMTVNVLKGNNIWASMDCAGPETGPGQIGTVDCFSTDKFKTGWSEVTVENSF